MTEDSWKRIAGFRVEEDGTIACVWLSLEPAAEVIHVYDCCIWKPQESATFPVIADAIANRGRWIPVAWSNKPFADRLLNDWSVNILPEPVEADPAVAVVETREVLQRMKSRQFKAKKGLQPWIDEWRTFQRDGGKVPLGSHPLMTATWFAMSQLQYAKAQKATRMNQKTYPDIAMLTCRR